MATHQSRACGSSPRAFALIASAVMLFSAVSARAQQLTRYVAPTDRTVVTHIEEGTGDRPYQVIWVQNSSSLPVVIDRIMLDHCENVWHGCMAMPLQIHVEPGASEVLLRVQPALTNRSYSFRYNIGWRADSSSTMARRVLAANAASSAQPENTAQPDAQSTVESAVQSSPQTSSPRAASSNDVLDLGRDELVNIGPMITRLSVAPDSIVMHVGQSFLARQVKVMAYGPKGVVLGRVRAYGVRLSGGILSAKGDTITAERAGRAAAELRAAPPAAHASVTLPIIVVADSSS